MESQAALVVFPSSAAVSLHGIGQITEDTGHLCRKDIQSPGWFVPRQEELQLIFTG